MSKKNTKIKHYRVLKSNIHVCRGGLSLCDFESCPYSPSKAIVEEYARDPVAWLGDFVCAFEKMTSVGYMAGELKPPTGRGILFLN